MNYDKLAILDVETTGTSAPYDRIIEIGVLRIENNKIVRKFQTLVNPETQIPPFIENMTGIYNKDLEFSPTFFEIKNDIADLLEGCILVAHNARFDYAFIKNEYKRLGISYSQKTFCTVKLSRHLFPDLLHHNLDKIIQRFDIKCERRHRAYDDAKVLWDFLQKLKKTFKNSEIQNAFDLILKKPSLPQYLTQNDIDNLPENSGVYIFYGKSEVPLYIGKSVNIKERVSSHFSGDVYSSTEMEISQQVERIETIVTGGELSALILESEMIKKLQPFYNRKLRNSKKLIILKKRKTKEGYYSIEFVNSTAIESYEIESVLGVFKSIKSAKEHLFGLVKEYFLCEYLLGLSQSIKPCFSYRLDWCKGACNNKEKSESYNARFILAFSKTKFKAWPFSGPILIKEENEIRKEALVFDKWCYLGKYSELDSFDVKSTKISDFDTYKILNSFLKNRTNYKKIKTLDRIDRDNVYLEESC